MFFSCCCFCFLHLRYSFMQPRLVLNSLHSWGWLWTPDLSYPGALRLGLPQIRKALYQWAVSQLLSDICVYSPAHALSRWHSDFYSYGVPWWALYFALLLKLLFRALVSQGLQTQGPRKAVNQSMKLTQNMVEGWRNSICLSPGKGTEPRDRHGNCVSIDIPNVVLALDPGPYTCQEGLHRWALSPLHILCLQSLHPMRHFYTECAVWLPLVKEHVPADARSDFLKMLEMRKLRLLYKSCDFKILAFFKISYREAPKCHSWKLSLAHRLTGLILLT